MNIANIGVGFILVLGVLILVHEWGHFIVARLFGVRVDVFSIGFGPRLFGWKRGATDYRVSAIPLGGYVRMAGQDPSEIDSNDQSAKPTGAADELMSKKRWQRALISLAGPVVNLIFPFFLLAGYFTFFGEAYPKYEDKPVVIANLPKASPLVKDGVTQDDRIVSVDGTANPTWGRAFSLLDKVSPGKGLQVVVEHQGTTKTLTVSTNGMQSPELLFGFPPEGPVVVDDVDPNLPAKAAGVKPGDVIQAVNGEPMKGWSAFINSIQETEGKPTSLTVLRNGQPVTLQITPQKGKNELGEVAWMVGIRRVQTKLDMGFRKVTFSQAAVRSGNLTLRGTLLVVDVVGRLVSGKTSPKELQSVVGIASMAGKAVQQGSYAVVELMAVLSVNLGILNLLPIPILDGGNILLLSMEGIRRRDFSMAFKERFVQVGLVFLLILFAYVMYNDVMRHLPFRS
jgi:regulator of sigma E protease